jgi:hypothetical protein
MKNKFKYIAFGIIYLIVIIILGAYFYKEGISIF